MLRRRAFKLTYSSLINLVTLEIGLAIHCLSLTNFNYKNNHYQEE